ncbi:MAG: aminotransferase class V-fold PLP-dependent enzyme, partial [Planctomycetaceae bacterium]
EEYYANAYRGVYRFGDRDSRELEDSRERIRRFIGADSTDEIIFTSGTTAGINLVANAWGRKFLKPGDEIVLNELEHHANLVPWQWIARQTGAVLTYVSLTDDGRFDVEALGRALSSKSRLVAVTGMSNVLGTVPPLTEIIAKAKAAGALMLVDGAQSVPHMPTHVVQDGIDFLAFSGHKLYGPSGIGVVYGRRELLDAMDPFLCGGHMIERVTTDGFTVAPLPAKFEAGTLPIAQAIALGRAVEFVTDLGFCPVHEHEQSVLRYAWQQMRKVPGLCIYGPDTSHRGAIVSFTIEGAAAQDIAQLLDLKGVFVRHGHHCTMPLHARLGVPATVRASFGIYSTRQDVDTLIDALHFARRELKLD